MKNGVLMTILCLINGINDIPEQHAEENTDDSTEDTGDNNTEEE